LISEVKWYKQRIGLPKIRNFVGVMKDITENYFVPVNLRNRRYKNNTLDDRYTDCGAFFSVTPFTGDAQNYAWAHGIYLISFDNNRIFQPLIEKADEIIMNEIINNNYLRSTLTRKKITDMAQNHFQNERYLKNQFDNIYSYIAILDDVYPVFITASGDFNFDPTAPDEINRDMINQDREDYATKEYRLEDTDSINFRFGYRNINFEFTIPKNTSKRIIDAIENTYKGEPFSHLDIPIEIRSEKGRFRRIYRIDLAVGGESLVSQIKQL